MSLASLARNSLAALWLLLAVAWPAYAQAEPLDGPWHGTLTTPNGSLRLVLHVETGSDGELSAALESIDQAPGQMIPVSEIAIDDGRMHFAIQMIGAAYEGEWMPGEERFSGTFTQGLALPLDWQRGEFETARVEGMDGFWEGVLTRNGVDLRLHLRVRSEDGGTVASLDSPDLGVAGLPVTGLVRQGNAVSFAVPDAGVVYEAHYESPGDRLPDRLNGSWQREGFETSDVVFTRTRETSEAIARPRPQTPQPPFPYSIEEVRFDNPEAEGVTLAGTLTVPAGDGPFPTAILITGSGPQDRDETVFEHKPFQVLADALSRRGIAVLRYDDRGIAGSTGSHTGATSADFATDANAAFAFLNGRAEIAADAIGFIGHSEGGMIAPLAARQNEALAYMVLLAPPGTNTIDLILAQMRLAGLAQGASEEELDRALPIQAAIMRAVAASETPQQVEAEIRAILSDEALESLGAPASAREMVVTRLNDPWYRFFTRYEPAETLAGSTVPLLALYGELDIQVPPQSNLPALEAALAGHPDATVIELNGLNHLFQPAQTGAIGEYADIETTFDPATMEIIADWILERFARN